MLFSVCFLKQFYDPVLYMVISQTPKLHPLADFMLLLYFGG